MKRIVKKSNRVYELFVNVSKKNLRVVEYGTWYVSEGSIGLERKDIDSLLKDTDHDIDFIIRCVYMQFINRRNPYFSSKTGKPLSKWFDL